MKTSHRIIAALIGLGFAAGAAQAQTVDQRHYDQQRRIDQGLRSGSMTPGEAHRVERQQHSIDRQEARMRYRDGGHLNDYDRQRLEDRLNQLNDQLHWMHAPPPRPW